jgi:inorganic phosphate transporter, PiT family
MDGTVVYVLVIVLVALSFDFINGFHDSANSIATVVSTRVLTPGVAVFWAAFFNFIAAFVIGTAVATTIGKGLIDSDVVDPSVILGGLIGAIVWDLVTWWGGLPSSSSHALLGGYAGAAIAKSGFGALIPGGWTLPLLFIVVSPLLGMTISLLLTVGLSWPLRNAPPGPVDRVFRRLQLISAGLYSLSHGANDAQKTMGIIVSLLVATQTHFNGATGWLSHLYLPNADHIPLWIVLAAHIAIALGTAFGGWRIVKTMGSRITKLRPFGGFCAETAGGITVLLATSLGVPVSTTHTITGAIVGVGAAQRVSAVRWGVAGRIVWAWVLTMGLGAHDPHECRDRGGGVPGPAGVTLS